MSGPGQADIDRTLYPLRRFLRLAASGNPSILMCLWAPVHHSTYRGCDSSGSARRTAVDAVVVPFERWWDTCLDLDEQLERLARDESIPPAADRPRIEQWSQDAHISSWAEHRLVPGDRIGP